MGKSKTQSKQGGHQTSKDEGRLREYLLTEGEGRMAGVISRIQTYREHQAFPVLIVGESGSGKEYVARLLLSDEKPGDVKHHSVNCAALGSESLLSELFGHVTGAYTGADKEREGLLTTSQSGIFLDEFDKAGAGFQNALLRYLRNGEIRKLGADRIETVKPIPVVLATSVPADAIYGTRFRRMYEEVRRHDQRTIEEFERPQSDESQFDVTRSRENDWYPDLLRKHVGWYDAVLEQANETGLSVDFLNRITNFIIEMPPLRERLKDIPKLLRCLLEERKVSEEEWYIDGELVLFMMKYEWPGNIAEFMAFFRNGLSFSHDNTIDLASCKWYFGSHFDLVQYALPSISNRKREDSYAVRYLLSPPKPPDFKLPEFKIYDAKGHLFKLSDFARVWRDTLYWIDEDQADRKVDDKVDQFFKTRDHCPTKKACYEELGFNSLRPFNKWLKDNHLFWPKQRKAD